MARRVIIILIIIMIIMIIIIIMIPARGPLTSFRQPS